MNKIITLFQRNYDTDRLVRNEVVPGAEWVLAREGVATRKWDGTCCLVRDHKLYKRYEFKPKGNKQPPANFEPAQDPDPTTGAVPGWIPVGDGPEDQYHREAWSLNPEIADGTYELCGPKVGGGHHTGPNPEQLPTHVLIPHGQVHLPEAPRTFDALREYLAGRDIEGIVWHHPDGRMVKLKKRDFGL